MNETALDGIRVLDLTASLSGPYCTMILGALGADVVKVERPRTGDDTRVWGPPYWNGESPVFLAMNPGKRSIEIDLKSRVGLRTMFALIETADVFVQNLRPGHAEALGLGYERAIELNPRLIYCSIGAFGSVGPLRHQPGYDPLMQASAGLMSVTGEPDGPPVRVGVSLVDQGAGMWAALGVMAALYRRGDHDGPQLVETSLYETALNWLPYQIGAYLGTGEVPKPTGSGIAMLAPYEAFATEDSAIVVAAGNDALFGRLCEVLELSSLAAAERFATNENRVRNRAELTALLAARLRTAPSAHWLERFDLAGVPSAPIRTVDEAVAHEQTEALQILQDFEHPTVNGLRLVAPPISLDRQRLRFKCRPPLLGEHTDEILAEIGLDALLDGGVRPTAATSPHPRSDVS